MIMLETPEMSTGFDINMSKKGREGKITYLARYTTASVSSRSSCLEIGAYLKAHLDSQSKYSCIWDLQKFPILQVDFAEM